MEPWKDLIGNGDGIFCIFDTNQVNEVVYTSRYLEVLTAKAAEDYAGMVSQVALSQGVFENLTTNQFHLLKMVKENVLRIDLAQYVFNKRFYYNPNISQGEALSLIKTGYISTLLTDGDTIELTEANGSDFLEFLL